MCGIAGYVGRFQPDLLGRMNRAQGHRGPDGSGQWHDADAGLAHVRLAILDLSPNGAQPMADAAGKVIVSFNGEIYNYRELRAGLERDGVVFRGGSDTEVLANLLAREGRACLPRLNGIFAFAAWFPAERKLLLARDAAGVKPLYWTTTPEGRLFASELKAFRGLPGVDWSLDPAAVSAYLTLLYAPGELTPAKGVRKLTPGSYLEWTADGKVHGGSFVAPHYSAEIQPFTDRQAAEACRHYLGQAVRRQLVSDVPLGGFLSGGVDSSAIAHFACAELGDAKRYPCFTVGSADLAGLANEGFAEDHPYAELMARRLGAPLHDAVLRSSALEDLDAMVWTLDEPTADVAAFTAHAVCREAREHGVKVLLSGSGGDDLFTGYRRHAALQAERYWTWAPRPLRTLMRRSTQGLSARSPLVRRLGKLFRYADAEPAERLASYFLWISQDTLAPALSPALREDLGAKRPVDLLLRSLESLPEGVSRLNQMLHLDRSHFLADHNLNYTDKMAMACGVEVRLPFLDPDLVAFSERLEDERKISGPIGKHVLRRSLQGVLPDEILTRPKAGFGLPLRQLLHGVYGERLRELARSGRLDATGLFSGEGAVALLEADKRGEVDAAYPLLAILCLESWVRQFAGR
ncbi:MAG: asparagine synthase (glutamine-hydrolyzing) [Opitutales bacterium]